MPDAATEAPGAWSVSMASAQVMAEAETVLLARAHALSAASVSALNESSMFPEMELLMQAGKDLTKICLRMSSIVALSSKCCSSSEKFCGPLVPEVRGCQKRV